MRPPTSQARPSGYRKLLLASIGEASKKALADIDALLDGIAKDA
jgi:hypothetical protein